MKSVKIKSTFFKIKKNSFIRLDNTTKYKLVQS